MFKFSKKKKRVYLAELNNVSAKDTKDACPCFWLWLYHNDQLLKSLSRNSWASETDKLKALSLTRFDEDNKREQVDQAERIIKDTPIMEAVTKYPSSVSLHGSILLTEEDYLKYSFLFQHATQMIEV